MKIYDAIIIGAGAAGLKAAGVLRTRKKSVLILDMGNAPARKVAVSGGGNCNFTNTSADFTRYVGANPQFVRSALAQYSPQNTLDWVKSHGIKYYEKEPGRYFCTDGAGHIVNALLRDIGNTEIKYNACVTDVQKSDEVFTIETDNCAFYAKSLILAPGGISYPDLGVSHAGYIIAKKFSHKIVPPRPALCAIKTKAFDSELAGISCGAEITTEKHKLTGDLLFTHFGIGGPAVYRASLFGSQNMTVNFAPGLCVFEYLKKFKQTNGKKSVANIIANILPNKLAHFLSTDARNIADVPDKELQKIADKINRFEINDGQAYGLRVAEVTAGGISTEKISSKTMESTLCSKLFFAGEVMDITGDLGGFNLQWAFASGYVAGLNA